MSNYTSGYDEGYRAGMQKMREVGQVRIEELEATLFKALERTKKLLYWLDIDDEFWESLTDMEKADHRHMQSEVTSIKCIMTGDDNG
jgi:hypothetical protein